MKTRAVMCVWCSLVLRESFCVLVSTTTTILSLCELIYSACCIRLGEIGCVLCVKCIGELLCVVCHR